MQRRKRRGIKPCPPVLLRTRPPLADSKLGGLIAKAINAGVQEAVYKPPIF